MPEPSPHNLFTPPPPGRIDIHSHLIPNVDDGCADLDQAITCIRAQQEMGYVGSICTPHIWINLFPDNTMPNIRAWTDTLRTALREHHVDYHLWPGGELRLFHDIIAWLETNEVPTLANSRCVLTDFWEPYWPGWVDAAFDWLLARDYQPILAHPERLAIHDLPQRLDALTAKGVLLQGNFRPFTGEDSFLADQWVRQFAMQDRYTFLALDMHRPDTLESRLEGVRIAEREFGRDYVEQRTNHAPRQHIFAATNQT
ncbi:MAG: CpsB/CapC family capsule biosynthesis tyrosine phosphatase [bacterium]